MSSLAVGRGSAGFAALLLRRGRIGWLGVIPVAIVGMTVSLSAAGFWGVSPLSERVGNVVLDSTVLGMAGVGIVLTGRRRRDEPSGLADLLDATAGSRGAREVGWTLGTLGLAAAPVIAVVIALSLALSVLAADPRGLVDGLLGVAVVVAPAAVWVAALADLLGRLLPPVAARISVVVVWFYTTVISSTLVGLPSPTGTVFSPLGGYPLHVWFGLPRVWADRGHTAVLSPPPSTATALVAMFGVLVSAAVFFAIGRLVGRVRRDSSRIRLRTGSRP